MASLQSKYDHAAELARTQPPVVKLAYLVNELKAWADLNPGKLQILHGEFAGLLREMRELAQPDEDAARRAYETFYGEPYAAWESLNGPTQELWAQVARAARESH